MYINSLSSHFSIPIRTRKWAAQIFLTLQLAWSNGSIPLLLMSLPLRQSLNKMSSFLSPILGVPPTFKAWWQLRRKSVLRRLISIWPSPTRLSMKLARWYWRSTAQEHRQGTTYRCFTNLVNGLEFLGAERNSILTGLCMLRYLHLGQTMLIIRLIRQVDWSMKWLWSFRICCSCSKLELFQWAPRNHLNSCSQLQMIYFLSLLLHRPTWIKKADMGAIDFKWTPCYNAFFFS